MHTKQLKYANKQRFDMFSYLPGNMYYECIFNVHKSHSSCVSEQNKTLNASNKTTTPDYLSL